MFPVKCRCCKGRKSYKSPGDLCKACRKNDRSRSCCQSRIMWTAFAQIGVSMENIGYRFDDD